MQVRKSYIEFIRIIACLSVILLHIHLCLFGTSNDIISIYINFGVAVFIMIIGYASYNESKNYKKQLLKMIKIFSLGILTLVISIILYNWIIGEKSLLNCLLSIPFKEFKILILNIITLHIPDYKYITSHLWYINLYCLLLIMYPILKKMCTNKKEENLFRRIVLILFIIKMIINDLIKINIIDSVDYLPKIFNDDLLIYPIVGYELYIHRNENKTKKIVTIIFLITIGLLYKYMLFNIASDTYYRENPTMGNLIYSTGIFILLANIGRIFKNNKIINFIGNKTLGIYLIHYMIIEKLKTCSFYHRTYQNMYNLSPMQQFLWELLYAILIFILCLVSVTIIKYVFSKIKQLILHLKPKKNNR